MGGASIRSTRFSQTRRQPFSLLDEGTESKVQAGALDLAYLRTQAQHLTVVEFLERALAEASLEG
jgi:hypothetical protein